MPQIGLLALAAGFIAAPLFASELFVTILDELGQPVAARVYLVDGDARPVFPTGVIVYDKVRPDGVSERHFVPRRGKFMVDLKPGAYRLTVERGKEYSPESLAVAMPRSGRVSRTIRLRRWIDMAQRGWYAGDMHVHRPLADIATLMEAEDLAVTLPITRWRTNRQVHSDPDLDRFLADTGADGFFRCDENCFFPVLNQELEPRASALLASRLGRIPVPLDYPLASFGHQVEFHGGLSDSEKATSWELPALAAVGACRTVGVANNHLWRSGSYVSPWGAWPSDMPGHYGPNCVGYVQAGFDMYAALLNAGFTLKVSAGSASGVHPVPPGWSRIYVHSGRPLSPDSWFQALLEGRSFVTTGPMLLLTVNGREPGEEIHVAGFPLPLSIEVAMLSLQPVDSVEVAVNSSVYKVRLTPDSSAPHRYRGTLNTSARSSAWIAARWTSARGATTCDAAHTSPVYVYHGKAAVPIDSTAVRMLLDRVDRLIAAVTASDTGGAMQADTKELRVETLAYLTRAREIYADKLERHAHKPRGP